MFSYNDSTMRISILCPTRKRPTWAARMAQSAFQKASLPDEVEVLFRCDDDDISSTIELLQLTRPLPHVEIIKGPRERGYMSLGKFWNELASVARGEILMMSDDDTFFPDGSWDVAYYQASKKFPDQIVCLAVKDEKLASMTTAITRRWYEAVGHFASPNYAHPDSYLHEIARKINRLHMVEGMRVDHRWVQEHAPQDENLLEAITARQDNRSIDQFWSAPAESERNEAANKLRKLMNT